ncbi:uncharacterized protein LOC143370368 [Andrena cerasifolii]|uniref:uncharacterized protein LOC143370368 n=1 Tax=Andrena cerasifolii TaxID=2819439 RepID=UPI004038015C
MMVFRLGTIQVMLPGRAMQMRVERQMKEKKRKKRKKTKEKTTTKAAGPRSGQKQLTEETELKRPRSVNPCYLSARRAAPPDTPSTHELRSSSSTAEFITVSEHKALE